MRHRSWFQDLAYNFLAKNNICLVWNQLGDIKAPPVVTTDFLYLRLIGDRGIQEKDFGRVQIDRVLEMQRWAESIKTVEDERVRLAIITANNHYAGFGPGTVNIFRNMLGLPEATWRDHDKLEGNSEPQKANSKQSTLSDFLG